jgi:serine/threonine-protein kinase
MDEDPDLDKLAELVADGNSIDWEGLARGAADDPRRRLLEHLRIIVDIAERHRSAIDEDPAADASTHPEPAADIALPHRSVPDGVVASGHLQQWGHLLLRRKIGEGSFGEVYHAHDTWLDHPVALKLLKPEVAARDTSHRILHEARRLARVRHPNVVTVHGADLHDGRLGFWMELIEGETLSSLLASGRMSAKEAAQIGQEVCLALAAVHHAGLVHRDVKAQNVMRTNDGGRIILMDFGAGQPMGIPATGRPQGTPLYVAPEIFAGAPADIATDIYALGVLLYHLVTGLYPVSGASLQELLDAHRGGKRQQLRNERPDLPDWFVTAVERALDPAPSLRFKSSGDFHVALSPPPVGQTGTTRWLAIRTGLAAAAGLLVLTLGLGVLGSRAFEVVLRIDPEFSAGLAGYLRVGGRALWSFALVWAMAAAAFAGVAGIVAWILPHTGPVGRACRRIEAAIDPTFAGIVVVTAGVAGLAAVTWGFYDVYYALTALALDPHPESLDLSILGPAGRGLHRLHSQGTVMISFLLGLAALRWFPRLERRAPDPGRVQRLKWAALVVALFAVAAETGTRGFLWDDREVVSFKNRRAFVIGTSGTELLLYAPAKGERTYSRVRIDDADLSRNLTSGALFEQDNGN